PRAGNAPLRNDAESVCKRPPSTSPAERNAAKKAETWDARAGSRVSDVATLYKLPTFAEGDIFHVVVESPRGSAVKLKYRPASRTTPRAPPRNSIPYRFGSPAERLRTASVRVQYLRQ